ncbi:MULTISPECIES: HNH endonuclease [Alphaproteobacteria]|uniref:HNH endonuclease n=1 Tax=Alphaproteobacteria TaxID=28211 RepID=UPI00329A0113
MIRLIKGDPPERLVKHAARWTKSVLDKLSKGEKLTSSDVGRYNHAEIKGALLSETHSKCAYCESKVRHVTYGDIEHVVPKSDDPSRMFAWDNLTIACDVCNTNKKNAPVQDDTFVDPYRVDPEFAFWPQGPLVFALPGRDDALRTERLLKLNRGELVERRTERLKYLNSLLQNIENAKSEDVKQILWNDFCDEAESDKEYAALARCLRGDASERLGLVVV